MTLQMKGQILVERDHETGKVMVRVGKQTVKLSPEAARLFAARLVVAADEEAEEAFTFVREGVNTVGDIASVVGQAKTSVNRLSKLLGWNRI